MNFGATLKALLDARSMTVSELSRRTGINKYRLYACIQRNSNRFDPGLVADIAAALDISTEDFLRQVGISQTPQPTGNGIDAKNLSTRFMEYVSGNGGIIIDGTNASGSETEVIASAIDFAVDAVRALRGNNDE